MAKTAKKLSDFGSATKQRRSQTVDRPDVDLRLTKASRQYSPGEILSCEYQIDLRGTQSVEGKSVIAIETSVLWMTQGKGDSDIGVHFFERREKQNVLPEVLNNRHTLSTKLPQSPMSYDGEIIKVKWIVRVRMFMEDGSEETYDEEFRLGQIRLLTTPPLEIVSDDEGDE